MYLLWKVGVISPKTEKETREGETEETDANQEEPADKANDLWEWKENDSPLRRERSKIWSLCRAHEC